MIGRKGPEDSQRGGLVQLILGLLILTLFPSFGWAEIEIVIAEDGFNCPIGWFWGPDNFEECFSENAKGVSSRKGVQMIILACAKLYPTTKNSTPLSSKEEKFYKCLLRELKGVSNDVAAEVALIRCSQKYLNR